VQSWGTMSDAEKMYQRIASKPSNAMFTLIGRHGEGRQARIEFQIRKTKSSFKSPEVPERGEYRFGPQLHLSGFLVDTQNFNLDKREPNLITLNGLVSSENDPSDQPDPSDQQPDVELSLHQNLNTEGSCPILYVWDEVASEWVNRGKVIHTANHEDKETTSLVSVSPKARRFRLAEEELEVAFVRRTQLLLTLRDGQRISIDPSEREGAQFPRKISAYRSASFNYSVPEAYVSAGIARAELAVTGFYTRYSTILASRLFKPNPRPRGRP